MSARRRVLLLVAVVAAGAIAVVAAAVLSSNSGSATPTSADPGLRPGRPPLSFAHGFRADLEARDLARGAALYQRGDMNSAAALFAKYDSLEAKVGSAFAAWPDGTLDRLEQLAKLYPESGLVQVHLGLARLWTNRADPVSAWQKAVEAEPDTPYAIVAGSLLHPKLPRGLPAFIPSFAAPREVTRLAPARQLEALRVRAERGGVRELLLYGVGLQRVGRPVSAAQVFDQAAQRSSGNAEAQVAAAIGSFDKSRPEVAFGRLGPLTRTFPNEPSVRFHLGVLLLWTGRVDAAKRQFRIASRTKPGSPLARESVRYLETIRKAGPLRLRIYDPKGQTPVEVTTADVARRSAHLQTFGDSSTVFFRLTKRGATNFHALTRSLSRRGARKGQPQRFFVAIDGRVHARVLVDYRVFPNGLDGRSGIQIEGVDLKTARDFVRRIRQE